MIVCSCNVLSDGQIRACMGPGPDCPRTPAQVYRCLGCGPRCGRCAKTIRAVMDSALAAVHSECATACHERCPVAERVVADMQSADMQPAD